MAAGVANRDPEKERYWRQKLAAWRESGLSMAQFCKKQGLNDNTFSSWKYIIRDRDLESPMANASTKKKSLPAFTKVDIMQPELMTEAPVMEQPNSDSSNTITAELINAETGMKLRVFSGADQATLAAVLSAWSGRG